MVYVASFHPEDPDEIVAATLACRICLSGDVEWSLAGEPYDTRARCRCRRCGDEHPVYLSPSQALRLALAPVHT